MTICKSSRSTTIQQLNVDDKSMNFMHQNDWLKKKQMTLSSSPICEKQVKYINRCVDKSQWTWPEETNWIKWSLDQLIVSTKLHIAWNRRYLHGLETFSIWSLQPSTPSYTVLSHKISETKIWDLMNILARKELCKLNDFASWRKKNMRFTAWTSTKR